MAGLAMLGLSLVAAVAVFFVLRVDEGVDDKPEEISATNDREPINS